MSRHAHRANAHRTHRTDTTRATHDANGTVHFWDDFSYYEHPVGGAGIDRRESPLPMATLDAGRRFDAILSGPVDRPRWDAGVTDKIDKIDMVEPYGWGV